MYNQILREKNILMQLDHSFIIKLVKTFKNQERLCFLTEYVDGDDLHTVCTELGELSNQDALFYTACIVLMLEHLQERRIAHRDLKPENIIVGSDGYPMFIDFGTAKLINERTYTQLGTPHYMAPEVLTG
jgi:cGMP-dependent protein kinase